MPDNDEIGEEPRNKYVNGLMLFWHKFSLLYLSLLFYTARLEIYLSPSENVASIIY